VEHVQSMHRQRSSRRLQRAGLLGRRVRCRSGTVWLSKVAPCHIKDWRELSLPLNTGSALAVLKTAA
jgi:hypothetical protein